MCSAGGSAEHKPYVPSKMPKKGWVLPENPLLGLFIENQGSTSAKRGQIESQIFFQNFIFRFFLMVMKFFETVHSIGVFCSFEAIVISSAGCELLLLLLKNDCENISKCRIANFLFKGDPSCQQQFLVSKVINWLVGQKWSQWLLSTTFNHQIKFHCLNLTDSHEWPAKNQKTECLHIEIGFWEVEKVIEE